MNGARAKVEEQDPPLFAALHVKWLAKKAIGVACLTPVGGKPVTVSPPQNPCGDAAGFAT
jgi:hypothetical protein